MFSGFHSSPSRRSPSVNSENWGFSGASSCTWSPTRSSTNASPATSVASSCRTTSSIQSNGVKTKQIRDLKLEVELRDDRINELEAEYEELERRSNFRQGEMQCKIDEQSRDIETMAKEHAALKTTIDTLQEQNKEVLASLENFKMLHESFRTVAARCQELEMLRSTQEKKEKEEAERRAQKEQEEAKAKALAKASEEEKRLAEEAQRAAQAAQQQRPLPTRPMPPPQQQKAPPKKKKDCVIM